MRAIVVIGLMLVSQVGTAAGMGGRTLLPQQKPFPSQADVEKALAKLEKDPMDPDANTIAGKYKAFVMGDYEGAMPFLVHSKDATLKSLAEHELDATRTVTASQKMEMGDEWMAGTKKHPALARNFQDRASDWYRRAWPDLEGAAKLKARETGRRLSASRPPGVVKGPLPNAWTPSAGMAGTSPVRDGTVARTGSHSAKVSPGDPKVPGSYSAVMAEMIVVKGGSPLEAAMYVMTDGSDGASDRMEIGYLDQAGNPVHFERLLLPMDMPFWTRVVLKSKVPEKAVRAQVAAYFSSRQGNLWIDDLSMKMDGNEVPMKNPSLEGK